MEPNGVRYDLQFGAVTAANMFGARARVGGGGVAPSASIHIDVGAHVKGRVFEERKGGSWKKGCEGGGGGGTLSSQAPRSNCQRTCLTRPQPEPSRTRQTALAPPFPCRSRPATGPGSRSRWPAPGTHDSPCAASPVSNPCKPTHQTSNARINPLQANPPNFKRPYQTDPQKNNRAHPDTHELITTLRSHF